MVVFFLQSVFYNNRRAATVARSFDFGRARLTNTYGRSERCMTFKFLSNTHVKTSASTPRRQCFGFFLIRTVNKAGRLNFTVSCQQARMLSTQNRWNCRVQSVVRLSTVACWLNTSVAAAVLSAESAHVDARMHATHHAGCCVAKTNLLNHFWSIRVSFQVSLSVVLSD